MKHQFRDWPKRIHVKNTPYFFTFYTKDRNQYFRERIFCDVFLDNLCLAKDQKDFYLYGWVILYEHVHLMLQPYGKWNISEIMFTIKKHSAHNINRILGYAPMPIKSPVSGQALVHLHKDLHGYQEELTTKYGIGEHQPPFKWQQSFYDRYMRHKKQFDTTLDYIIHNPHKHGLPDNWPYVFTNPKYRYLTDDP